MATADETEVTIDALLTAAQTLASAGNTGEKRGARVTATSGREHGVVTYASESHLLTDFDGGSPQPVRVDRTGTTKADSAVLVHEGATHVLVIARMRKP